MKHINKAFTDIREYFAIYILIILAIALFVNNLIGG
jgi:hypothetical protein